MPTYPLPTLAPSIGLAGISTPSYADIYASLQATFQGIYSTDAYIDPDSQDGQLLAAFAQAISDCNSAAVAVYNSFSPVTAQGSALSSNVKINGIARSVASNGSVLLRVTGQVGATITNGVASDAQNNQWLLPASVTIPGAGYIDVTATAAAQGNISGPAGTITQIVTPQLGWQSVNNLSDAAPGDPVETDAALRRRQTTSTALPSLTVLDGIVGAVEALPGVSEVRAYENDSGATDGNGVPAHSIAMMVIGGVAADIANAIYLKKTPGAYTYGTTSISVLSPDGIPNTIRFTIPSQITVTAAITIKALSGYTTAVAAQIQAAVAAYINSVLIGGGSSGVVEWDQAIVAARSVSQASTFKIVSLTLSGPGGAGTPDVPVGFNQVPVATTGGIVMTVT